MQKVSMRYRCAYHATGKWGRVASIPPCRNRHRPPPKCRSRPQRRRSPRRPRMIDRCSVRVGDTQLSISHLSISLSTSYEPRDRSVVSLPVSSTRWRRFRPVGSVEAPLSATDHAAGCPKLRGHSLGQSLNSHTGHGHLGRAGQPYRHSLLHSLLPVVSFSVIVPVCWPKTITSLPSSVTSTPRKPCVPVPSSPPLSVHIMLPSLPTEVSMRVT